MAADESALPAVTGSAPLSAALAGGAVALRDRLRAGELTCVAVAEAFLAAVGEDELRAWAALDAAAVMERAVALDRLDERDRAALPLYGLPIGIKDNFDTVDYPTEYGSPIYAGQRPERDAGAVRLFRDAGAVIAGKTKLSEFAWMFATDTLNPLDHARTPGGSSSGSAAAVAAGTIPLATGTQTAGSINRPGSYCAVVAYKPTFGTFPRDGVKMLADSLDTVGLFARSIEDVRLAAGVLAPGHAWVSGAPRPPGAAPRTPGAAPRIALMRTSHWSVVEPPARAAIERVAHAAAEAGARVDEIEPPEGFAELVAAQTTIQWVESAANLAPELATSPELLSDEIRNALHEGATMPAERYFDAKRAADEHGPELARRLDGYDGVLTPSASGVPPLGLYFTGDPLFCRVETLIGAPAVSIPLAWTVEGLPAGLQLIGAPSRDARTLDCAAWLLERLGDLRSPAATPRDRDPAPPGS
jgi:Asp-tRNA(Asn)/Glu-tRNA(Gln) amidotransferase A subunit family amidase